MKRSALKVGEEYLASTEKDWESRSYRNDRVRVLSLDLWALRGWVTAMAKAQRVTLHDGREVVVPVSYAPASEFRTGNRVLVEMVANGRIEAVPLSQLRTTWVEGQVLVAKAERATQEREENRQREVEQVRQRTSSIAHRLEQLGLEAGLMNFRGSGYTVTPDVIEHLLDSAEGEKDG